MCVESSHPWSISDSKLRLSNTNLLSKECQFTSLVVSWSSESGMVGWATLFLTGLGGGYFLYTQPVPSPTLPFAPSRKKLLFNTRFFFTLSSGSRADEALSLDPVENKQLQSEVLFKNAQYQVTMNEYLLLCGILLKKGPFNHWESLMCV